MTFSNDVLKECDPSSVLFINLIYVIGLVIFCKLYPVSFENARFLSEEIVIQGYRIPSQVS